MLTTAGPVTVFLSLAYFDSDKPSFVPCLFIQFWRHGWNPRQAFPAHESRHRALISNLEGR